VSVGDRSVGRYPCVPGDDRMPTGRPTTGGIRPANERFNPILAGALYDGLAIEDIQGFEVFIEREVFETEPTVFSSRTEQLPEREG